MDYSAESCMNTFTTGQKNLMKGVLNGPCAGLSTTPTKVRPNNDAVLNALPVAINPACTGSGTASTTTGASITLPYTTACNNATPNDVWFSFTAVASDIDLTLSNIVATNGTSTTLA